MDDTTAYREQMASLRLQVQELGGVSVDPICLRRLCPDNLSVSAQFMRIAEIARSEGWSFSFLPDGGVRFIAYQEVHAPTSF
jgi:hypothetical protein